MTWTLSREERIYIVKRGVEQSCGNPIGVCAYIKRPSELEIVLSLM